MSEEDIQEAAAPSAVQDLRIDEIGVVVYYGSEPCAAGEIYCGGDFIYGGDFFYQSEPAVIALGNLKEPTCECGAAKIGVKPKAPGHSDWCPAS